MAAPEVSNKITEAIKVELESIQATHGKFYHGTHEGYGVLLEEAEECHDCFRNIENEMYILWGKVKTNFESIENTDNATNLMKIMIEAKNLAEEAVQVAAVCQKFIQTIDAVGVED